MWALHNATWGALLLAAGNGGRANDKDDVCMHRAATALFTLLSLLAGGGAPTRH
jgi:hypothetical protein